jgi:hypothetical protein
MAMIKLNVGDNMEQFKRGLDMAFGPDPVYEPLTKRQKRWNKFVDTVDSIIQIGGLICIAFLIFLIFYILFTHFIMHTK